MTNGNNKKVLRTHYDCDGLITGIFASYKYPYELEIWDGEFGDTTGMVDGSVMCDMHPLQDKDIIVIDHHESENGYPLVHKYELHYDVVPASLIAWRMFKDEIPKDKWWLLCAGVCGDGQPELLNYEVFESCPRLLNQTKTYAGEYKGKWSFRYFPTYKLLSSPINSYLRMKKFDKAIELVMGANQPSDIINDIGASNAKSDVRKEFQNIMMNCDIIPFQNLRVVIFNSKYRMSGYVASVVESTEGITTLAIDRGSKHGSLRGELANYWKHRLNKLDYIHVDGHPGFCGARIKKDTSVLIDDLTEMLQ